MSNNIDKLTINHINNESILFVNKSGLPILVEGWVKVDFGLEQLTSVCIESDKEQEVYSSTQEWNLTTYFYDPIIAMKWKQNNLEIGENIGKFRSVPCYRGNYAWMYTDLFNTVYNDNKIIFTCNKNF